MIFLAIVAFIVVWFIITAMSDSKGLGLVCAFSVFAGIVFLGNGSSYCVVDTPMCIESVRQNEEREARDMAQRERECRTPRHHPSNCIRTE